MIEEFSFKPEIALIYRLFFLVIYYTKSTTDNT